MDEPTAEMIKPAQKKRRGRKKEDWNVIDGGFAAKKRPEPPDDLTAAQAAIWRKVVATEPPDFFASYAAQEMLKDLCSHRATVDAMNQEFKNFRIEWMKSDEGMRKLREFINIRGTETRNFASAARQLRLTNQSRYTPQAAATASRNTAKVRPWEEED